MQKLVGSRSGTQFALGDKVREGSVILTLEAAGAANAINCYLDRDIDDAAQDVQAAINAARALLPSALPSNPTYRKINPADAPILILSLTSDLVSRGRMYDVASSILQQKLSQIDGVGQVTVGGGSEVVTGVGALPRWSWQAMQLSLTM